MDDAQILNYVNRFDTYHAGKTLEDKILQDLSESDIAIAGFPGVGKSAMV
jgi:hypothetical protein